MPLTRKERRKYLASLKEKNAAGEHIASDPAGLLLQRGKRDPFAVFETPEGDIDRGAGSSSKGVVDEIIDLAVSPQKKKARTGRKDVEKSLKKTLWQRSTLFTANLFGTMTSNTVSIWRSMSLLLP